LFIVTGLLVFCSNSGGEKRIPSFSLQFLHRLDRGGICIDISNEIERRELKVRTVTLNCQSNARIELSLQLIGRLERQMVKPSANEMASAHGKCGQNGVFNCGRPPHESDLPELDAHRPKDKSNHGQVPHSTRNSPH
jgi:hypothetical protein